MGAYSPAPVVTPRLHARIMREIIQPTVAGMAAEGVNYTGFLYAGVMVDPEGAPRVLEFNCRMGDPETQPILMRLKSDLLALLEHGCNGTLDRIEAEWDRRTALSVVMAAADYPGTPRQGDLIHGLSNTLDDCKVFHAGTVRVDAQTLTRGGRVLAVTALGDSVRMAQKKAYEQLALIGFEGAQYRRDIGHLALGRKK
jgi:phosphoribosylamine--glycine ligase